MALCLDGTPGAFYIYGNATRSSKWHIHTVGGAWCSMHVSDTQQIMMNSCFNRSSSWLGSSSIYWPGEQDLSSGEWVSGEIDYMSSDPEINPLMHDWNKAILVYCDGGSFAGRRTEPAEVNGRKLYFRGNYILEAVIDTLKTKYGLSDASDVVISGVSAGGLSTYMHTDQWRASLPSSTFVVGLADAGFFPEWDATKPTESNLAKLPAEAWQGFRSWYNGSIGPETAQNTYAEELHSIYYDFNSSGGTHQGCVAAYTMTKGDPSACMFAEYVLPFVQTPIFTLTSLVDAYQIVHISGNPEGPEGYRQTNLYRQHLTSRILAVIPHLPNHGGFFESCVHHGGKWGEISIDGFHQRDAFSAWYKAQRLAWQNGTVASGRKIWWQAEEYKCDDCCKD